MNKILPYSAMNSNANFPPPYSILNPDTNSDSPSARSNGARFVSAKHLINHIISNGNMITKNQRVCVNFMSFKLNDKASINTLIRIKAILISYEIVCAIARIAPIKEYFEFEAHPDSRIANTFNLETAKKNKILNLNTEILKTDV